MLLRPLASAIRGYLWITRPHPGRGYLGRFAAWLDPRDIFREVAPGTKVRLSMANAEHIAIWQGRYEEHQELAVFLELLQPGMTVIDIGANVGMYAAAVSWKVGQEGKVYTFEPLAHLYRHLLDTLAINNCTNVTAKQLALSDKCGTATFHVGRWDSIGSLVRGSANGPSVEVETATLDSFLETQRVERVDAVKIDVEGAEPFVLSGMHDTIQRDKPILLVEHNYPALQAAGSSAEQLFARIVGYGYKASAIIGGKLVPVNGLIEPSRRHSEPTMNYVFIHPPAA